MISPTHLRNDERDLKDQVDGQWEEVYIAHPARMRYEINFANATELRIS